MVGNVSSSPMWMVGFDALEPPSLLWILRARLGLLDARVIMLLGGRLAKEATDE
jgi:hypothetical protein